MKVLELFAGTRSIGKAFEAAGHEVFSIEWDKQHPNIDWYTDIGEITAYEILRKFGSPDIIWASPDCTSYSIAAISHHRTQEPDGNLKPKSDYAKFCDSVNIHVLELIEELNPIFYFIENPRGGMRKMRFMKDIPRHTAWYCQYGDMRAKPTDIWTNHSTIHLKTCKNGNKDCHHQPAPRGSKTGTQGLKGSVERSIIPERLCEYIVEICEEGVKEFENK